MTSQRLILTLIAVCLLCAIPSEVNAWWTFWRYGGDTHADITKDVLNNLNKEKDPSLDLAADYPDLLRFKAKLMTGSNTESHNIPDGVDTEWWWPKDEQIELWFTAGRIEEKKDGWLEGALSVYTNYNFNGAYLNIGREIHLVQDQSVPAHRLYCCHGKSKRDWDDLEEKANSFHYYAPRSKDQTFQFSLGRGVFIKFNYWLDDKKDDDDRDELKVDTSDEVNKKGELIKDGPTLDWGVANTDWGTYGMPKFTDGPKGIQLSERVPGRDEGIDYFNEIGNANNHQIIYAQLFEAYNNTLTLMKLRSKALPPLVPDNLLFGKPSISLKIFGPNKPVEISFVAMENRKPKVSVFVLAGTGGIKDMTGKVWDGGANATRDLLPGTGLPWRDTITTKWNGDMGTKQIDDGEHVITMQVKDQDKKYSEKRTRTVKFDKTPPEATITFRDSLKDSYP